MFDLFFTSKPLHRLSGISYFIFYPLANNKATLLLPVHFKTTVQDKRLLQYFHNDRDCAIYGNVLTLIFRFCLLHVLFSTVYPLVKQPFTPPINLSFCYKTRRLVFSFNSFYNISFYIHKRSLPEYCSLMNIENTFK